MKRKVFHLFMYALVALATIVYVLGMFFLTVKVAKWIWFF